MISVLGQFPLLCDPVVQTDFPVLALLWRAAHTWPRGVTTEGSGRVSTLQGPSVAPCAQHPKSHLPPSPCIRTPPPLGLWQPPHCGLCPRFSVLCPRRSEIVRLRAWSVGRVSARSRVQPCCCKWCCSPCLGLSRVLLCPCARSSNADTGCFHVSTTVNAAAAGMGVRCL